VRGQGFGIRPCPAWCELSIWVKWAPKLDLILIPSPLLFSRSLPGLRLYIRPLYPDDPTVLMHHPSQPPPRYQPRRFVSLLPAHRLRNLTPVFLASVGCYRFNLDLHGPTRLAHDRPADGPRVDDDVDMPGSFLGRGISVWDTRLPGVADSLLPPHDHPLLSPIRTVELSLPLPAFPPPFLCLKP
jgi:hypothetical protein